MTRKLRSFDANFERLQEVNILKRMTRSIAETFVEEITIYDSEKIEVKFVFDDLLVDMANRIEKKKEGIA